MFCGEIYLAGEREEHAYCTPDYQTSLYSTTGWHYEGECGCIPIKELMNLLGGSSSLGRGGTLPRRFCSCQAAFDVETVEALACKEGLALATNLMLQKIRLTTDCAAAVKSIAGEGMGSYGHIVQELKARHQDFTSIEFVHEHRDSKGDAHTIARSSIYKFLGRHVWFLTPPE
jgi:hypothetical protein